jgi:Carboxypeptidase regulatory-like domain
MRLLRFSLLSAGMLLCMLALGSMLVSTSAQAQSLPDRPTLTPRSEDRSTRPTTVPSGRITGTVIDATTGAPASNIAVMVGDVTVTSDANGNYDRSSLPAGSYPVALVLAEGQGTPDQGTLTISLESGATVVQHLRFHSPAAPAPTAAPTPVRLPDTGDGRPRDPSGALLALGVALILAASMVRRRA